MNVRISVILNKRDCDDVQKAAVNFVEKKTD
jgi:hypothetical protein